MCHIGGTTKFAQSKLDCAKQKAGYHPHVDTLPLLVLRLEARTYVSGEDAPVSASFLVDIPTGLGAAAESAGQRLTGCVC